ncbi:YobI family P-loop NTPase [Rahnella sp. PCH160]|uniref:YobI family P-loop NTPase n=1 Tax=Rahnella sp. PCH160 TaxID=3447928 RepID=UPI0039FC68AD
MAILEKIKKYFMNSGTDSQDQEPTESHDEGGYDTLTPKVISNDSVREYFKALNFAFSKKDVKNIAVTGPYGAGKSTVILSYLETQLKKGYINVSLADFSMSGRHDINPPSNAEIELSILQQILYKENKDNLPDSRIDRIQNRNKKHIIALFWSCLSIIVPGVLLLTSTFPNKIISAFGASKENISSFNDEFYLRLALSGVFALTTLFFIVRVASKAGLFDKKIKLSKLAFLEGSAEMASQEGASLLNNCLDEIVYFFSRSNYKIVVFEDLDRLGNTEVFIKLREINQIVNNNVQGEPVRFVYACRDDIFLGADIRTKFFDFILPIIPVMDSRNAYTHLKNKLIGFPENHTTLLKQTSLYISDMRSLQNITNEFNIFKQLVDGGKDVAKIYALMFYKNNYAQDYNLADKKSGVLYSFINEYRLRKLHKEYFESLEEQSKLLSEKITRLNSESANSKEDVRKELICKFISFQSWGIMKFATRETNYPYYYTQIEPQQLHEYEGEFNLFFNQSVPLYIGYGIGQVNSSNVNYIKIDASSIIEEYEQRSQLVSTDRARALKLAHDELNVIKDEIRIRNSITLADLIINIGEIKFREITDRYLEKIDDRDIIDKKQFEALRSGLRLGGYEVLYFLMANGYIMQDFMMFRSIFHEGTISGNDNDYIKAVGRHVSCKDTNENFSLDNEKDVLGELVAQNYIYREGALHYQLIEFFMDNQNTANNSYLSGMVYKIFENNFYSILSVYDVLDNKFINPRSYSKFVVYSLENNSFLDRMVSALSALSESEYVENLIKLSINMIAYVNPDVSKDIDSYREFIQGRDYKLVSHLDEETLTPFMNNIIKLDVIYSTITFPVTDIETKALIIVTDNNLYDFTRENYRVVVAGVLQDDNITCELVDETPLSLINEYNLTKIKSYIDSHIDIFVRDVFIDSKEDSTTIVSLLKYSVLSHELRIEILKKMQFTVDNLQSFTDDVEVDEADYSYRCKYPGKPDHSLLEIFRHTDYVPGGDRHAQSTIHRTPDHRRSEVRRSRTHR